MKNNDEYWMGIALEEAKIAFSEDEIPIGAVLIKDDCLVGRNHNRTRQLQNPLAHAEKLVIEQIVPSKEKYLQKYTLYSTLEPCVMCTGILLSSRIGRIVYGCDDQKAGACGSIMNIPSDRQMNHNPEIKRYILDKECSEILTKFFQLKR
ncbi:MAG: nucleoside deaminase [Candidatus Cloacimonetes bacterium]|nr:nucleoside deaminase [Candidatus Cloacimonadota bacterium]